jgi:putative aldouronate transport system substrate-binding protein
MVKKKGLWVPLVVALTVVTTGGCSTGDKKVEPGQSESASASETAYLEVWSGLNETVPIEKNSKYSEYLVKNAGVGIIAPTVPWEGGEAYLQRLNTRIASGNLPDLFLPWKGNETTLIKQGALADLTDYLPKYAPHVWNGISQEIWNVVRTADPTGKGRIYYIPQVHDYTYYGAFIRRDWLDNLGLKVPTTKDEYVNVLKQFRDKDANGNGDLNDEIPVSGREGGRWMDHLFGMYGVAMWEGFPMWDLYNGELTYSAVTPNMKAALQFIRELYGEKLLDQKTFLNQGSDWQAGIHSDKIGSWFHINTLSAARMTNIVKVNPKVELAALGIPKVEGYTGFISNTPINRPNWVVANKNENTTINALKLLDWAADPKNQENLSLGVEGVHHQNANGKMVLLPVDPAKTEMRTIQSFINTIDSIQITNKIESNSISDPSLIKLYNNRNQVLLDAQKYGKRVVGEGIPASVYDGFADIRNHTLYQEYMTKIIIGEYSIDKFDEFVAKWNQSGGKQVTEKAREWFKKLK